MKQAVFALALILTGATLVAGLSADANAGARKACKEMIRAHPVQGKHHALMKQCKAGYKTHKTVAR